MMYLINFILCSGLLLAVYKLFLQNERMYRFNRFYLLFSLVFSAVVPFVVITAETETIPVVYQEAMRETFTPTIDTTPQATETIAVTKAEPVDYSIILIGGYLLVSALLIFRFSLNLIKICRRVVAGPHIIHHDTELVLTDADVTPHSFLGYIFVNRADYQQGTIEPEVICHERAHVKQLHSLDVLFIELVQAVCWFNPFIPFYRKAIQLNHEFLADEAVTSRFEDTPAYQYLLLSRASQPGNLQLSSQFNYQTTKKRLMMMTKTTSAKMAWGKKLMLLPVAALAVILFSEKVQAKVLPAIVAAVPETFKTIKVEAAKDTAKKKVRFPSPQISEAFRVKSAETDAPQSLTDEYAAIQNKYLGKGAKAFAFRNVSPADKAKMDELYQQMSRAQQDKQRIQFSKAQLPRKKKPVTAEQLAKWQDKIYDVQVNWKKVSKEELAKYTADDFDWMNVNGAGQWAFKDHGAKKVVTLVTKTYFAEENRKIMADRSNMMWVRSSVD